jgi:hypothetical protein
MKNNLKNNGVAISMLVLIFTIFFLVMLDTQLHIIGKTWWYDTLLHLLGGVWVGNLFIYIFSQRLVIFDGKKNLFYTLAVILGFVALVGVGWELYEFMIDQTIGVKYALPLAQPSIADTMKDLASDLLGGTLTAIIYYLR